MPIKNNKWHEHNCYTSERTTGGIKGKLSGSNKDLLRNIEKLPLRLDFDTLIHDSVDNAFA